MRFLDAMMGSTDFYANEVVVVRTPSVYKGRFVMVGDAGYAPNFTGTGTTLALTGAYVLAGEIASHKGDLSAGLKGYEERMRPIIDDMQKVPPFVTTIMAPQTAWGIWLRKQYLCIHCLDQCLWSMLRGSSAVLRKRKTSMGCRTMSVLCESMGAL